MRLYLDTCCLNRPYDDQSQLKIHLETEAKLHIQQKILLGEYELAWSYVLDYEISQNPYRERRSRIREWKGIAHLDCEESETILTTAEKLQKKGLKTADALHVAAAISLHCDYFLTTDSKILNKNIKTIMILDPIEFIREEAAT